MIPPAPCMAVMGFGLNYLLAFGLGTKHYINKNNVISLNCIYDYYILNDFSLAAWKDINYISRNTITLNLSYYFNF